MTYKYYHSKTARVHYVIYCLYDDSSTVAIHSAYRPSDPTVNSNNYICSAKVNIELALGRKHKPPTVVILLRNNTPHLQHTREPNLSLLNTLPSSRMLCGNGEYKAKWGPPLPESLIPLDLFH